MISSSFDKIVGPLVARMDQLEGRIKEREFDMIVYKNAYDNLIKELGEMKNKLKMVPAGKYPKVEALINDFEKKQNVLSAQRRNLDF